MLATEGLCHKLRELLEQAAAQRLLCVGDAASGLARQCGGAPSQSLAPAEAVSALQDQQAPADLALVTDLATVPRQQAGELLAALRDIHARRVLVASLAPADHWSHKDLIGYGFSRAYREARDGEVLALYEFSITTYKTTPDWLNPRNWANPQNWDKYRW